MSNWAKTGEAYFGDSFDRKITLGPGELSFSANNCVIDQDALSSIVGYDSANTYAMATSYEKPISIGYCGDISAKADSVSALQVDISARVDQLEEKLDTVMARIDELKQSVSRTSRLRSLLRTLHYNSEVESGANF